MTSSATNGPPTPAGRCHVLWDRDDLPAWGTAARAAFWLALEVPGPWGPLAPTQCHLDPDVGGWLEQWCTERGGRLVLIRRPGRHADAHTSWRGRLLVASSLAGTPWLGGADMADLATLRERVSSLDRVADLTEDDHPGWLSTEQGTLLVCTNARRDQCCALVGRPIAAAVAALAPGRVWECSHLGGHRFAPTVLALPTGQVLARVGTELAHQVLTDLDRGRLTTTTPRHDRGRSHLSAADQVADIAARLGLVGVPVQGDAGVLAESCGKAAVPVTVWGLA